MNIKEFYLKNYPHDELGNEINETATFEGLLRTLIINGDVYEYIGVEDSIIRRSIFDELANTLKVNYDHIYNLWMNQRQAHHNHNI
jgi:hypothetical protein